MQRCSVNRWWRSAWFGVAWPGLAWFEIPQVWEITSLTRLSQDDGTFTQGKLPRISISISISISIRISINIIISISIRIS